MQDTYLMEKIEDFANEQLPPRNVHAIGYGAFGSFTATNPEAPKYSKAKMFMPGTKTPFVSRFSGVFNERGEADHNRDARGFALKFKSAEGNWDLLTVNTAVFNCRDMKIGPDFIRSLKRDPRTGLKNRDMAFDFSSFHPESLHATLMLYTDRCGTPTSFRSQHWWGANTYSLINAANERFWCRFHIVSMQGEPEGFTKTEATTVAGEEPGFLGKDLYDAIERGEFPKWRLCVQVMPEAQGYTLPYAFDCTKVWKHDEFPLVELGIIECNQNPIDHFSQVEQVAFSPSHVVPGIGFSPDKLLQGRLLMYEATQRHRIGPNYKMLPINCPVVDINSNYYNGGNMNLVSRDKFPNYYGTQFMGNSPISDPGQLEPLMATSGPAGYYDMPGEGTDFDWYEQPRQFVAVLNEKEFNGLCLNLAGDLSKCTEAVMTAFTTHLEKVDKRLYDNVMTLIKTRRAGGGRLPSEVVVETACSTLKGMPAKANARDAQINAQ